MQRLILFSSDYPPNGGGISRLCSEIRKQCIKRNVDFFVVTLVDGPEEDKTIRIVDKKPHNYIKAVRYLKSIKKKGDVALTGLYHPDGVIAKLAGLKTVTLAHGAEVLTRDPRISRCFWPLYRKIALKHMDGVISNSNYTANLTKQCCSTVKVVPIPLCVDNVRFHPTALKYNDGILHICSISRLLVFKGHDFLIRTISKLPDSYKLKIKLTIGGTGQYKPVLEQMTNDLKLNDQISFAGFIPEEELNDFYSQNDVFILTTREDKSISQVEGFGLVFTEAQACGTPCIGTKAGGIPDAILDGYGGWLIEQDNEEQLSKLLMKLIDNPSLCKQHSAFALDRIAKHCTWDIYFDKLYSELTKY